MEDDEGSESVWDDDTKPNSELNDNDKAKVEKSLFSEKLDNEEDSIWDSEGDDKGLRIFFSLLITSYTVHKLSKTRISF